MWLMLVRMALLQSYNYNPLVALKVQDFAKEEGAEVVIISAKVESEIART